MAEHHQVLVDQTLQLSRFREEGFKKLPEVITTQPRSSSPDVIQQQPSQITEKEPMQSMQVQRKHLPYHGLDVAYDTNKSDCWYGLVNCFHYYSCCQFDPISNMSLYEAITRYEEEFVLPVEGFIERVTKNRFMIAILENLCKAYPDFFFTYLPTGSLREGFGKLIPSSSILATDYDIMLVPDAVTVGEMGVYSFESPVFVAIDAPKDILDGYLWLKLEDKYLNQWEQLCLRRHVGREGCSFLSSSKMLETIKDTIRGTREIVDLTQQYYGESDANVTVTSNGPAMTVEVSASHPIACSSEKRQRNFFYADYTLGIHCVTWPTVAKGFFTSEYRKNWPSNEVVELIKKLGCHVVPKATAESLIKLSLEQSECTTFGRSPGLEWRYSFSQPEILLSRNIPPAARTAFLAFKALVKQHFNNLFGKISSYALKGILYRVVERERKEYWNEETYTNLVENIFMKMLALFNEHLKASFCPNYWIPSINLFEKLTEKEFFSKRNLMVLVLENPKKYLTSPWLEYMRYVRLNCCYCGNGYILPVYKGIIHETNHKENCCVCCRIPCSYNGNEWPCESLKYKIDPLSLDVY